MRIGFIDFSKKERDSILATLKLLGVQGALDELGIGVIRDAYADLLFPGISTIQTRAKYFVLIPYLFYSANKKKFTNAREVHNWIKKSEDKLVEILVRNSDVQETGIIGSNALKQNRTVKMKPSDIYWNGLRIFEILRNNKMSFSSACNITYLSSKRKAEIEIKTDGESFDDKSAKEKEMVLFSPIIPDYDFEKKASIKLTKKEAEFLADKIYSGIMTKDTLLAFLINNKIICNSFLDIPISILPPPIKRDYSLARDFSDFIIGAHIRYNVIFSEYEDEVMMNNWNEWKKGFSENKEFNLENVLGRVVCNPSVQAFCRNFFIHAQKNDLKSVDELIIYREKAVKETRAKLCKPKEYRYNPDNPIHFYKLDFRYGVAKIIIEDIIDGLGLE